MSFWLSVADKRTTAQRIPLIPDAQFHLITIAGLEAHPLLACDMEFELDLFGYQHVTPSKRVSGNVWAEFVRLPVGYTSIADGDPFALCTFPVWSEDATWAAVLTAKRTVKAELRLLGVAYRTEVPNLTLANDVLIADPA